MPSLTAVNILLGINFRIVVPISYTWHLRATLPSMCRRRSGWSLLTFGEIVALEVLARSHDWKAALGGEADSIKLREMTI